MQETLLSVNHVIPTLCHIALAGNDETRVALAVPEPIANLILREAWKSLLLQGDWGSDDQIRLFEDWPPNAWRPQSDEPRPPVEFSWHTLGQALKAVRDVAEALPPLPEPALNGDGDDDEIAARDCSAALSRVAWMLQSWQSSLEGDSAAYCGRGSAMHSSEKMIRYLRLVWYSGSTNRLERIIKHALTASMSPLFAAGILQALETPKKQPSKSSLKRYRLVLDVSYLLLSQVENQAANHAGCQRYLWADSSPSKHHNWLWVEQHSVSSDLQLRSCFHAAREICVALRAPNVDPFDLADSVWQHFSTLASAISHHIHTPVALGSGKKMSDAAQKASAMAHSFALENPSWADLHAYLDSFVSVTTDLGAESSLAYFHVDLKELFPSWHDLNPLEIDGEDMHVQAGEPRVQVLGQRYFLPNALPVMGMQHCVHNLLKQVHTTLEHWHEFWQDLKNLESLLNWPFRRRRFIVTCVRGSPFQHLEERFEGFSQSLYEARWHEVAKFVGKVRPLLGPLRSVWDVQRFERGGVDEDGGPLSSAPVGAAAFDPHALTRSLQCPRFGAYVCLVNKLEQCPEQLASWAENCTCHEFVCEGMSQYKRQELLKTHYEITGVCPMAGKRAPELAAGHAEHVFQEICDRALADILIDAPLPLPPEGQQQIISELQRAQNHLKLLLFAKLQHWQRMPWLACGLAHHSEDVARDVARKILLSFEECSDAELHHRLTQQFLAQPLYAELERFAGGLSFEQTSPDFQTAVMRLRFVPVVETIIESKHAVSTRLHKRDTHAGPVMVSLYNRMVILEQRLEHEPGFFCKLAQQMAGARHLGTLPAKLGLHRHPLFIELENSKGRRGVAAFLQKPLTAVIYRTDLDGQYKPLTTARRQHEHFHKQNEDRIQSALQEHKGSQQALGVGDQVRHALILDHFRTVASSSDGRAMVFSLPSHAQVSMQRLADFFAKPDARQSARNSGVLEDCAEDLQAASNDDQAAGSRPVFFTVTKARPSANHHLYVHPGAGPSLKSKHVAIALHSSAPAVAGQFSVSCQNVESQGAGDGIAILSTCDGNPADLEAGLKCWSTDSALEYSTPDGGSEVKDLLSHMVDLRYFVDEGDYYVPHPDKAEIAERLCSQGYLESNRMGGFAVGKSGLAKLTLHWKVKDPQPLCSVRAGLAIEDLTAYELVLKLEEEGFSWCRLPPAAKRQLALPYAPGREKVWYSTHALPPLAYFQALLQAEEIITAGVHAEIAHGKDKKFYLAVLAGESVECRTRHPKRRALLDADADLPLPCPAQQARSKQRRRGLPAAPESLPAGFDAPGSPDSQPDSVMQELLQYFDSSEPEENKVEGGAVVEGGIGDFLAAPDTPEAPTPPPGRDAPPAPSSPQPPNSEVVPGGVEGVAGHREGGHAGADAERDDLVHVQRMLSSSRWGVCRLTPKQPGSKGGGRYGGFEGTCPFHKRNNVTGCKKYVSIKGPGDEPRDKAFRQVLYWCCQAHDVSRQREHLRVPLEPVPDMAVLQARKITSGPAGPVKSDIELDAEEAAAGRRRERAEAKGAAKAKAKVKAKPKPLPRSPSNEAASDPSSDSSDSSTASASSSSDSSDSSSTDS